MKDLIPVTSCWRAQLTFGEMSPVDRCTTDSPKWRLTGALMTINGRNLKIFSASVVDLSGKPGQILSGEKELVIAAGKGALSLSEVQLEGKRRMSASEFLRGHASISRAAS